MELGHKTQSEREIKGGMIEDSTTKPRPVGILSNRST
jgi:hypothetical protein